MRYELRLLFDWPTDGAPVAVFVRQLLKRMLRSYCGVCRRVELSEVQQ